LLRLATKKRKLTYEIEALNQYQTIITQHKNGIYVDEALFFGDYNKQTVPEKVKPLYEKILI
jgi:hypothetical protein